MKTSDKQIAANRKNAAKSTGPVTDAGKQIASRNALKHGLLAREVIITDGEGAEDTAEFEALLADFQAHYDPQGPMEAILVEKIAVAHWRLRRAHRHETGLIRSNLDELTRNYYQKKNIIGESLHKTDEQVDAEIDQAREMLTAWQQTKKQITNLTKTGKDLSDSYDDDVWDCLADKLDEIESAPEVDTESHDTLRKSLNAAGWPDRRIADWLLEICDENIKYQQDNIDKLQAEKQTNRLTLQVKKKRASIPDAGKVNLLLRYETAIEKQFYKAVDQLERLQRRRAGEAVPPPVNVDVNLSSDNDK